ncbi:MAG: dihydrofolate reductase family protein, partial [Nocardioides sp.]
RDLAADVQLRGGPAPLIHVRSHDPADVLAAVPDALRVLVEGGPQIIGAFLAADLVDELHVYLAPVLLGDGFPSVLDQSVATLTEAHHFHRESVTALGDDLLITLSKTATS